MNAGALKTLALITGALVAGEALALLVGMYLLSPRPNPWISAPHTLMIALDIFCGAGLIALTLAHTGSLRGGLLLAAVLVSLAAHAYREWEYFAAPAATRFLSNAPLFVLNNVKLIGLMLIAGLFLR